MFKSGYDINHNGRKQDLSAFMKANQIKFKNISLLDQAFYHASYANESTGIKINNERLEFLGDSVLGIAAASYLYNRFPEKPEGELAKIKAVVVSEKTLAAVALKRGIPALLLFGHGEELSGGREKPALLADCVEAIIGALYLDSGFDVAERFIFSFLIEEIERVAAQKTGKDYKSELQEFCQRKYKTCPSYHLVNRTGPDHDVTFTITVQIADLQEFGPVSGKSRKEAEQKAAKCALNYFFPE